MKWSDSELTFVKSLYSSTGARELALKLNRSYSSVINMARKLKLRRARNPYTCLRCDKMFFAPPSQQRKYCSHTCYAEAKKGLINHTQTDEAKEKIKLNHWSRRMQSHRKGMTMEQEYGVTKASELKERIRLNRIQAWENPIFAHKVLTKLHARPNGLERILLDICQRYNLPYKYVGDGSFLIGTLNPDFINANGERVALEVFDRAFHDPNYKYRIKEIPIYQTEEGRKYYFRQHGWECIIFWDGELKSQTVDANVLEKVGGL